MNKRTLLLLKIKVELGLYEQRTVCANNTVSQQKPRFILFLCPTYAQNKAQTWFSHAPYAQQVLFYY